MNFVDYLKYKTIIEQIIPINIQNILNNKPYVVATIDDLETIPENYINAIVKDDQRGDFFNWSASGTVNNGITFLGLTGYWNRQYHGYVQLKWFCEHPLTAEYDNTAGFLAAIAYTSARRIPLQHLYGQCKISTGFLMNTQWNTVKLLGPGRENIPTNSCNFLLDSTDDTSYFLEFAAYGTLNIEGCIFRCLQEVKDREFLKLNATNIGLFIKDTVFYAVEKPIVFKTDSYLQSCSLNDILFYDSGTIHSESNVLVCSHLTLQNVNHEGKVPENTEKVLCNLQGIRTITVNNFLLEGELHQSGWTILKFDVPYNAYIGRYETAAINQFHTEWNLSFYQPEHIIDQKGGLVKWDYLDGLRIESKYKLSDYAIASIENTSFTGTHDVVSEFFELTDDTCQVELRNCVQRDLRLTDSRITHFNSQIQNDNSYATLTKVNVSNNGSIPLWEYGGGYISGSGATQYLFSGTTSYPSTDSTYGRKLVVIPSGNNCDIKIAIPMTGILSVGDQVTFLLKVLLPTFTSGLWVFQPAVSSDAFIQYFDTSYSNKVIDVILPIYLTTDQSTISIEIYNGTAAGVSGNMEIYAASILLGHSVPKKITKIYPANIVTHSNAAPTTGVWAVSDIVENTPKTVGQPKRWACTEAPCTWVSEGNL